jgi:hypothetical protein
METNVETSEINGYTEEEFRALLALMGLSTLFKSTRGADMGWEGRTPEERFYIIETYRRAIADRERSVNGKQ